MSLKLRKEFIIDGVVVELESRFAAIEVYSPKKDYDDVHTLYFVKDNKVVQTLRIMADCGQNVGYISELTFKGE